MVKRKRQFAPSPDHSDPAAIQAIHDVRLTVDGCRETLLELSEARSARVCLHDQHPEAERLAPASGCMHIPGCDMPARVATALRQRFTGAEAHHESKRGVLPVGCCTICKGCRRRSACATGIQPSPPPCAMPNMRLLPLARVAVIRTGCTMRALKSAVSPRMRRADRRRIPRPDAALIRPSCRCGEGLLRG